jgi:hypothetical protein
MTLNSSRLISFSAVLLPVRPRERLTVRPSPPATEDKGSVTFHKQTRVSITIKQHNAACVHANLDCELIVECQTGMSGTALVRDVEGQTDDFVSLSKAIAHSLQDLTGAHSTAQHSAGWVRTDQRQIRTHNGHWDRNGQGTQPARLRTHLNSVEEMAPEWSVSIASNASLISVSVILKYKPHP